MLVVYIAGPFRAASKHVAGHQDMFEVQRNIMAAMALGLKVWQAGAVALIPHANTMFFTGSADDSVWLRGDLELLYRCDALLLTEDYARSSGARAEREYALANDISVFYHIDNLLLWLKT